MQLLTLWEQQGQARLTAMDAFADMEAELATKLALVGKQISLASKEAETRESESVKDSDEEAMQEMEEQWRPQWSRRYRSAAARPERSSKVSIRRLLASCPGQRRRPKLPQEHRVAKRKRRRGGGQQAAP